MRVSSRVTVAQLVAQRGKHHLGRSSYGDVINTDTVGKLPRPRDHGPAVAVQIGPPTQEPRATLRWIRSQRFQAFRRPRCETPRLPLAMPRLFAHEHFESTGSESSRRDYQLAGDFIIHAVFVIQVLCTGKQKTTQATCRGLDPSSRTPRAGTRWGRGNGVGGSLAG